MSLPTSEHTPDDPELLPPARRRRARRLLAPMEAGEKAETLDRLALRTIPTFNFYVFSMLAGLILAAGLAFNSPVLLVLGAVITPLMAPLVGVSLGMITGSAKLFLRSLVGLLISSALIFAAGALVGLAARSWMPLDLSQAYAHATLSWASFLVVLVCGLFLCANIAHRERNPAPPSVALAYVIYVPLTVAGFGLTSGAPALWPDGLVLYTIYLAWAALIGALTLALLGFRPLTFFGYTLGGAVALICIILLIGFSGFGAVLGAFGTPLALPTPLPTATFTLTPPPTITPTLTPSLTPLPPSLTPTITASLTPSIAPTITPTGTPLPVYARINASEESGGAFIRGGPGFDNKPIVALTNGTLLQILPDFVEVDGAVWEHVIVVQTGLEGWILQRLLQVATPAPEW